MSNSKSKTRFEITDVRGSGNSSGGYVQGTGRITHDVTSKTQVYAEGTLGRGQSFNGGGGQTSGGFVVGITRKF
jgi:hypothetical protein